MLQCFRKVLFNCVHSTLFFWDPVYIITQSVDYDWAFITLKKFTARSKAWLPEITGLFANITSSVPDVGEVTGNKLAPWGNPVQERHQIKCMPWNARGSLIWSPLCSLAMIISTRQSLTLWETNGSQPVTSLDHNSMAQCKTAVTPLLTHWSSCSLALGHRLFMWQQWMMGNLGIFLTCDRSVNYNVPWPLSRQS